MQPINTSLPNDTPYKNIYNVNDKTLYIIRKYKLLPPSQVVNVIKLSCNINPIINNRCVQPNELEIIFPAISHLKLFLTDAAMGTIALLSKTFYNGMVSNYGQLNVDIFITKHYIDYWYDHIIFKEFVVPMRHDMGFCEEQDDEEMISRMPQEYIMAMQNIESLVGYHPHNMYMRKEAVITPLKQITIISEKKTIIVPFNVKLIALRKLRKLLGPELYFAEHKIIFFRSDFSYLKKYKSSMFKQMRICVFCGIDKEKISNCVCYENYGTTHDMTRQEGIEASGYTICMYPELEYAIVNNL